MLFARKVGGRWLDPREAQDLETCKRMYDNSAAGFLYEPCPQYAGDRPLKHNDIDNGDGTASDPLAASPPQPVRFERITGDAVVSLLVAVLGIDRADSILSTRKTVQLLLTRAAQVERNSGNMPSMLAFLKSKGDINDADIAAIDAAWPKAPA